MCLGSFDVNASADHVTFPRESGTLKRWGIKALLKQCAFLPPRLGEKAQNERIYFG
jgi:hypothetical protein